MRQANNTNADDQAIVESLYTLEVKLKVGQQRAQNWQEKQIKQKAANFNQKVANLHDENNATGLKAASEAKEMERLRQVVTKDQKMKEFAKLREENNNYIKQQNSDRANLVKMRVEQAKKDKRRQANQAIKKQTAKEEKGAEKTLTM